MNTSLSYERLLLDLLFEHSYIRKEKPEFTLSSGQKSCFYINSRKVTMMPQGNHLIGQIIYHKYKNININAVGGLTMGADPIAYSVADKYYLKDINVNPLVVRKDRKDHGIKTLIEGNFKPGDKVLVVDDVLTTGKSLLLAVNSFEEEGLEVVGAIVLVDRLEFNGNAIVKNRIKNYQSIFTIDDFLKREFLNRIIDNG